MGHALGLTIPHDASLNELPSAHPPVLKSAHISATSLYSGVFWDVQDVPLSDIDRIEVISGPGATLWGANAVNGVIN